VKEALQGAARPRWASDRTRRRVVYCPYCRHTDTRVLDSRVADDGTSIRRRRTCPVCGQRFTTVEQMQLTVVKRSGATEPFSREKAVAGVRKACKGRPVSEDDLARLGSEVEDSLRGSGKAEIDSNDVGLAVLTPLKELDQVAYLRFASVYKNFDSVDAFADEIAHMMSERADPDDLTSPTSLGSEHLTTSPHQESQ
jgi:transcriptional repressor NrdR